MALLRHRTGRIQIPSSNFTIRVTYSDMAKEMGFERWATDLRQMTETAIRILCEEGLDHNFGKFFVREIWVVRGGMGSFLLGSTLVFSPTLAAQGNQTLISFLNDTVWLLKRNECYYGKTLPLETCRGEAMAFAKQFLERIVKRTDAIR